MVVVEALPDSRVWVFKAGFVTSFFTQFSFLAGVVAMDSAMVDIHIQAEGADCVDLSHIISCSWFWAFFVGSVILFTTLSAFLVGVTVMGSVMVHINA